jgi:class 3 adenylate cyclase
LKADQSGFNKMATRRLAAILAADVAGFSARMELDESRMTLPDLATLWVKSIQTRITLTFDVDAYQETQCAAG